MIALVLAAAGDHADDDRGTLQPVLPHFSPVGCVIEPEEVHAVQGRGKIRTGLACGVVYKRGPVRQPLRRRRRYGEIEELQCPVSSMPVLHSTGFAPSWFVKTDATYRRSGSSAGMNRLDFIISNCFTAGLNSTFSESRNGGKVLFQADALSAPILGNNALLTDFLSVIWKPARLLNLYREQSHLRY